MSGLSGGSTALLDELGQRWDIRTVWHCETGAEVVPECDAELCAGFGEAEEGVAAVATGVASGAAADLSLCDLAADIVFRSVGVERNFGTIEHHQQFALVGMEPCEQAVEGDEASLAREDAVEPCPQGGAALRGGMPAIGFEIAIEPPDQCPDVTLGDALLMREGVELVNEPLGMDPAQAVLADIELTGIITDDDGVGQKAVRLDAAPQGALGGDHDGIGIDRESRDAELVEMGSPGGLIGEGFVRVFGQAGDDRAGEGALAHIGQCLGIDDVIAMTGAQQFEEVAAALRWGGSKPGEVCIANLGAEAVRSLVTRAGVVHRDPGGADEPGA